MTRALSAIIALVALLVSASLGYASFRMHGLGPAAPVISNISSGTPGTTTATITWTTSTASTSVVNYGLTSGYGSTVSDPSLVTSHSINLTGLTASTTYHFGVASKDVYNQTTTSTDQTFATAGGNNTLTPLAVRYIADLRQRRQ